MFFKKINPIVKKTYNEKQVFCPTAFPAPLLIFIQQIFSQVFFTFFKPTNKMLLLPLFLYKM